MSSREPSLISAKQSSRRMFFTGSRGTALVRFLLSSSKSVVIVSGLKLDNDEEIPDGKYAKAGVSLLRRFSRTGPDWFALSYAR